MNKLVELYTSKDCPNCKVLMRILKENNIEFLKKDIDNSDFLAEILMLGKQSVPVLLIDFQIYDTNKIDIEDLLKRIRGD